MKRYLKLYWQMLRVRVAIMLALFYLLAIGYKAHTIALTFELFISLLILATWYVNATTSNDISDYEIDKINLKKATGRPLIKNQASFKDLWILNAATLCICILLAGLLGKVPVGITLCALSLNYIYSLKPFQISHKGYIAPLLLPLGYVLFPFLLGFCTNNTRVWNTELPLIAALYTGFVGRIILKDFRDIKGDKKYGKNTFVVMHGKKATCVVSALFWTLGNILLVASLHPPIGLFIGTECLYFIILVCLYQLSMAKNHDEEQVLIGLAAKAANGQLLTLLTYFLLYNYPLRDQNIVPLIIAGLFSYIALSGLRHRDTVRLGYRG